MDVSVVIPTHNGSGHLAPALALIAAQEPPAGLAWEVILIDNGSTDDTAGVAQSAWPTAAPVPLRVVREDRLGLAYAHLRGFVEAQAPLVTWVEDDNHIAPNWLATVVEVMAEHPEVGACGGHNVLTPETADPPPWLERFKSAYACGPQGPKDGGDVTEERGFLWGAGMTVRAEAWSGLVARGWQPILDDRQGAGSYNSGGDAEICLALRLSGWRLWFEPRLRLEHHLLPQRLNWPYLRGLLRGSGASTVGLDPYRRALGAGEPRGWLPEARSLLRDLARGTPAALRAGEGDESVLVREQQLGRLGELLRLRGAYNRRLTSLTGARWVCDESAAPALS